ncbi:hypothetical protein [Flavobacterium sp. W22_SRS_FP1]|uniref:hypothetical protein n=1 Tax=Flavobacterium sp. W22_SRS_FP1 TaxID=3240276 RepID=UPI003F90F008
MVNSVKKESKIIIFCQAPADIPYVLSLYEKYKEEKLISVYVINVENVFKFIQGLNLNLSALVFIPYVLGTFKSVFQIIKERKRIKALKKQYFDLVINTDVYFFSRFEDWLTSSFVVGLEKRNSIYYIDHYDNSANFFAEKSRSIKVEIYGWILNYLTGVSFKLDIVEKLPEFPINRYNINREDAVLNPDVFVKYSYFVNVPFESKDNVLFFISECEETIFNSNFYNEKLKSIITDIKTIGFKVVVKGHPRIGMPESIKLISDYEIPSYVPGEFIDIELFRFCLGLETNAICYFAKSNKIPTYSLIRMFPSRNIDMIEILVNFLKNQSDNEIIFIDNEEQFCNVMRENFRDE